jgi:hypothetical protein
VEVFVGFGVLVDAGAIDIVPVLVGSGRTLIAPLLWGN